MRFLIAAALLAASTLPALADETTGTILAFDRKANIMVLQDKTVWSLELLAATPQDLVAGDKVRIVFDAAGEDGITLIREISKLAN